MVVVLCGGTQNRSTERRTEEKYLFRIVAQKENLLRTIHNSSIIDKTKDTSSASPSYKERLDRNDLLIYGLHHSEGREARIELPLTSLLQKCPHRRSA